MFKEYNINQLTLPFDFEVLIPSDAISVAIHEFVESMPATLFKGFEHTYGTSSYHPKMMVKIILCGYAQSVTSGRKIEALLTDSIRMMRLADRQVPSYRTINRFRVHPEMTAVIGEAFVQFRTSLQSAGLIDDETVFIDGTFMRMKEDHMRNGQLKAGYNIQAATHNQFVLGYDIFLNPTDARTLVPFLHTMLARFKYLPSKIVADAGYGSEFNYETLMERFQRIALIPYGMFFKAQKKTHQTNEMHPDNWQYDETNDQYICPNGRRIPFKQYRQRTDAYGFTRTFKIYESLDCTACPLYAACTKSKRQINKQIHKNMNLEYYKAEVRRQLSSKENAALYSQRKIDVETVFGNLKANLAFKRFSVRGKRKVNIEMGLAFMALNIRKWVKMKHPFQRKHKTGTHAWHYPSMCPGF